MPAQSAALPVLTRRLNRATLARQLLLAREPLSALAAVERLAGMQAQVPKPPFVGLWSRLEGFRREELTALLHGKQVVRATAMRATLHLLSTEDFLRWREVLQPMLTRGGQSIMQSRKVVLTEAELATVVAAGRAFFEAKPATFDALRPHLLETFPQWDERALAYATRMNVPLIQLPTDAEWCFPAAAEFTLAETWLGRAHAAEPGAARDLVRRYLAAFGPASVTDAQAWSGVGGLKSVFEELRPELLTFRDERKRELFDLPASPRPEEATPAPVRFLPEYDNLVLSHDDRTRVVPEAYRSRVVSKNLQVQATFLVDGMVAGTWRVARKKNSATLTVEPFEPLEPEARAELEREGLALLAFTDPDAVAKEVLFKEVLFME